MKNKKEYMREYWKEHKTERNEATKRWRRNHPEEARKLYKNSAAKWRVLNREKYNAYMREYRKRKKEELDKQKSA